MNWEIPVLTTQGPNFVATVLGYVEQLMENYFSCIRRCFKTCHSYLPVIYHNMEPEVIAKRRHGTESKKKKREKRKKKDPKEAKTTVQHVEKKRRPNYFIGTRFSNPEIVGKILALQQHVKLQNSHLAKACIPIATTHVTLAVMHLEDDIAVEKACAILQECKQEISSQLENTGFEINVKDLGHFRHQVLFAKLVDDEKLQKLVKVAEFLLKKLDEFVEQRDTFQPHLTILKLSKMKHAGKNKVKKIDPDLYKNFVKLHFGMQYVQSIQLLSMMKKKQADGYYFCESEISVGEEIGTNTCSWSLNDWAESVAVCCITTALMTNQFGNESKIDAFAEQLATNIINSCLTNSTGAVVDEKLQKFRETIRSEDVLKRIKKEIDSQTSEI